MANNYYLGQTPEEFFNQTSRYFYGLARTDDGFIAVTKINLDIDSEPVSLENPAAITDYTQTFDQFEEGVDFFEGVDQVTRMPNYQGMKYEQYKWSPDDLYYYVDGDGNLVVRTDFPYNYSEGATFYTNPELVLVGSGVDLGTITGNMNPMENRNIVDLSLVSDHEGTLIALDMGSIT